MIRLIAAAGMDERRANVMPPSHSCHFDSIIFEQSASLQTLIN